MEKLATYIVREGALPARDAAGWIVRLCLTLEPHHASGVAHGRVSAKSIHIEGPHPEAPGFLLDAPDLADDPAYFSLDRASGGVRSPESDTWAVGVTLYFALTGALPFAGNSADEVRDRLVHSIAAPLAVFDAGDDNLQLLIDQLFSRNFQERLKSLRQVRERLIEWDPTLGQLPPLAYGRPDETYRGHDIDDDTSDDDDNPMVVTSVAHKALYPELKAEILAQRERRERSAEPAPPPQTSADLMPHARTVVLDEPEPNNPALGTTMVSEPNPPADDPLGRTVVMSEGDDLASTQVREPRSVPRPQPTRGKMRTPFADTLPAAAVPAEGRAALARALGRTPPPPPRSSGPPSSGPTHELPKATRKLGTAQELHRDLRKEQPRPIEPIPPTLDAPPTPRPPPPLQSSPPAGSGIISGEIPSALELLSRPDSTPPPPPEPMRRSPPPMVPVAPPRRKRSSWLARLLIWMLLVGAGYVTFRFYGAAIWRYATRIVPALRRMEKEKPPRSAPPAPVASASAPAPATASAAAPAPSAAVADVRACVDPLFPANTFGEQELSFLCSETDPSKGAKTLHERVVAGGGKEGNSEAMKEWSTLGWYGMVVFAIARARCCKDAPPLSRPAAAKTCPLDESLTRLGAATFETSNDASEKALYAYRGAVKCVVDNGAAQAFGQQGEPRTSEFATFKKTYERARRLIAQK